MLERPTAKTAPHGKCVDDCLHLSHISLIVVIVIHYYYYNSYNNLKGCYYTCSCFRMFKTLVVCIVTFHMHTHIICIITQKIVILINHKDIVKLCRCILMFYVILAINRWIADR